MKIAVIGAGAIGGLVGAKLALAGEDVTFIVRAAETSRRLRSDGMQLITTQGDEHVARNVRATDDYAQAGPQDLVILAMKAHQVEAVVGDLPKLFGPETSIVTMQNGIPYWYFQKHGGPLKAAITSVDPQGAIAAGIPAERVIGCVVYPASELVAPGVVRHIEGDRFPLGELDGSTTERVQRIAACFVDAGFKAPVLDDIRAEIWLKLWGNLTFNPISSLAHSTLVDICQYPLTRRPRRLDDARGAGGGHQAGHRVSRAAGEAHCRSREGRQAQDLDAAGRGSRARTRDRRAGRLGGRAGAAHRYADAAHRQRVRAGQAAGAADAGAARACAAAGDGGGVRQDTNSASPLSLLTSAKSFRDNPLIGSRRLNHWGLHERRLRVAHSLAASRRARLGHLVSPEDRAAFDRDGFVLKHDVLPASTFERLRERVLAHAAPAREMVQGDTITRRIALDADFLRAQPELGNFIHGALWRGLNRYVGSYDQEPVSYIQSILSGVRGAPPDPQTRLHADTFHPTVKAWYFITDVEEDAGAFCYVPGSTPPHGRAHCLGAAAQPGGRWS